MLFKRLRRHGWCRRLETGAVDEVQRGGKSYGIAEARMAGALERRVAAGTLRRVEHTTTTTTLVDLSSNDYLGLARDRDLAKAHHRSELELLDNHQLNGSSGSRLLTGAAEAHDVLERWIAEFHGRESAVLFPSGYAANAGLAACVADASDALVLDELSHSSTRFGAARGRHRVTEFFRHNDVEDLREKITDLRRLSVVEGTIFVFVESVYSMDGDAAPLEQLAAVCREDGNACLIVDEAHATGVVGPQGRGALSPLEGDVVVAGVHTFGKALGCHGAAVVGSKTLTSYLANYAQPLIYATALPPSASRLAHLAYLRLAGPDGDRRRAHLSALTDVLHTGLADLASRHDVRLLPSASAIHALVVPGAPRVVAVADGLRASGFDVRPIRAPTVKPGSERLRFVAHAHNSIHDAQACLHALDDALLRHVPPSCDL